MTFEAQAAIELEAAARQVRRGEAPRYEGTVVVADDGDDVAVLDPSPLIVALLADLDAGVARPMLGGRLPRGDGNGDGRGWRRRWRARTAWTRWSSPAACSRTSG